MVYSDYLLSELCKFLGKWAGTHTIQLSVFGFFCSYIQTKNVSLSANCLNFLCPALEVYFRTVLYEICGMVLSFSPHPLCVRALRATQMLNYYGCLVMYRWKRNWMWYVEGFVLLCLISDQIFLNLRKKRLFPTIWEGFKFPCIWKTMCFLFTLLIVISVIPFWS